MNIEIKSWIDGSVLFSLETKSIKLAVEAAVKSRANLFRANLTGADLTRTNLFRANLSEADLTGADLFRANLFGANLSEANLTEANLTGARGVNKYICTPLLMLLDQPGEIRAYKLVNDNFEGPYQGGIKYVQGEEAVVGDGKANCDENEHCGAGINLATLDWCMKEWKTGYHILVAEFKREDIAAIPTGTDGKFRVKMCKIIGEKDLVEIGLVVR